MTIKIRLTFMVSAFCLWSCSNSTSETDDPIPDGEVAEFNDILPTDTDSSSIVDTIENEPLAIEGMLPVAASGKAVVLGTNNKSAPEKEKPQMKVVLDYDFMMARHETTCGEFVSAMKKFGPRNSFAETYKCKNDSLPIADVTYYDAILFANAKTKEFLAKQAKDASTLKNDIEMDTVYDYTQITMDEEGHCTSISSLVFHPEQNGFRLPTEAEWVKAASLEWDTDNSWNNSNSKFKSHNVCTRNYEDSSFCDMAGNVMEWVNDWLGKFKDTTIIGYIGAPDGGELGERILKGGAFNTDKISINTYSRGDVYTVTSSTRTDYVGFRLAYGEIPNPTWMGNDGFVKTSIISLQASSSDIYPYTKSFNVKLAFRNDVSGNLSYIDYSNGELSIIEIVDTINVYHPEISPDGNKVAFCTKMEGVSGKSFIYVRKLDEPGSDLVKLNVESAAIPRWKVLENGDTVITYVTDAGSNKNESTWKGYSTWQVSFAGNIFGIPKKILDGSFHGGISDDGNLAVTGAQLLRVRMNQDASVWYNGEQACNVSLVQDGSKRTAFLDFGGKTGQAYVGKKYVTHQYLFIADSTGKLTQYVTAPTGYTFDHSEWAVGETKNNMVATLTNVDGAHQKIVLINLAENAIVELAAGDELWHPNLWIKARKKNVASGNSAISSGSATTSSESQADESSSSESQTDENSSSSVIKSSDSIESSSSEDPIIPIIEDYEFDLDSAGMYYNTSGACVPALYYRYKMELLWQYKDSANIVIVGSSRSYNGVIPSVFSEPIFAVNLAIPMGILRSSKYMLENYVIPHYKRLKAVIISIDLDRGSNAGRNANNIFYTSYEAYPGYVYDKNHDFWKGYNTDMLYELTYDGLGSNSLGNKIRPTRGYPPSNAAGWGEPVVDDDSCWMDKGASLYQMNMTMFKDLLSICKKNNIVLIAVLFPTNPRYKETGAYSRHGLRRSQAPALIEELNALSDDYPNFILFDENKMGDHDYTDEMAQDLDHLATPGATQLTHRLDSLIQTLNIDFDN